MAVTNKNYDALLYEWAVKYTQDFGFYVIPIVPRGKSLPYEGIKYDDASKDIDTINKWFDVKDGIYRGHNIGIATGRSDGVFAVDQDIEEWEDAKNFPECPVQRTPSGGYHYLFKWREGASSSTSKIQKGIDTRGGTALSIKGHIVAFPSRTENGVYVWKNICKLPEIPDWIVDKMGKPWKKGIRGNENVSETDLENKLDEEQIERMLLSIDIDSLSYEDWLMIGQSINSQRPGEDGLSLWQRWSCIFIVLFMVVVINNCHFKKCGNLFPPGFFIGF